jgi:O-antigen/teichoic acid export membrane protein
LGPLTMGLYTELMLILEYGRFSHLGMINALEREMPFYMGKGDRRKVEEVQKTILTFITLAAFNIGTALFIFSFFGNVNGTGIRFIALLIFIETIVSFYEVLLQSYGRFKWWSLAIVILTILEVALKIIFVIKFGLNGLLTAMILIGITTIAVYHFWGKCKLDLRVKINLNETWRLLKLGTPLILFRGLYLVSISIDKLVIIFFLGRLQLGYYSIATMVFNYLTLLPKFSYKTLYPKFMRAFGKKENLEDIKKYLVIPNRVFSCFYSVLIGLTIILVPFCVAYFLPRFRNGIFAAQIVAFSTFFSALLYAWNYLLIAIYEQKRLALLYGISAVITLVVNLFFIKVLHLHLTGVAFATLISQIIFTTLLICYGYGYYTRKLFEHLKLLFAMYFPSLLIVIAFFLNMAYYPNLVSVRRDLFGAVLSCGLFLLISSPLMYHTVKKYGLLERLFESKKDKNA